MKGKLVGVAVALVTAAWVYTTFLQGTDFKAMLPEWAGGPGPVPPVEEAAREYVDAFDYRGSSGEDYRVQVERVVTAGYRDSPGGVEMEETADWLNEHGETWDYQVDLVDYRVDRQNEREAVGVVRYEAESKVDGRDFFRGLSEKEVRFVREGDGWAAAWGAESRTVEERGGGSADREESTQEATREIAETTSSGTGTGVTTTPPEASPGPSTAEQQRDEAGSVEEAVRSFNDAYDFEGTTEDAYVAQIEPYVTDDFWTSPRGAQNLASIEEIEAAGDTFVQDAELINWEPITVGIEEASGYATRSFESSVGEESGSYTLRHELRLKKEFGVWKVAWAGDDAEGQEGT